MPLKRALLGKRLIAATRIARWELELLVAMKRALKVQERHAIASLQHTPLVAAISSDAFDISGWNTAVAGDVTTAAQGIFDEIRKTTEGKFLTKPGELPGIDIFGRLDNLIETIDGLGPDTADALGVALTMGVAAGDSIGVLTQRVLDVFGAATSDAERIARTEVAGATNELAYNYASAVDQSGLMSMQKTWLSTLDERTRGSRPTDEFDHISADGETVGIDESFTMTGEELMFPGDEAGSPGNVINCRCTVVYDEAGTTYGDDLHIGY